MLVGKTLTMRAPEPGDVDWLYNQENKQLLWHLSDTNIPVSKFVLKEFIDSQQQNIFLLKQYRFMLEIRAGQICGCIDLFDCEFIHKRAAVGILIAEEFRQKGLGSEALLLMEEYAKSIGLHQLSAGVMLNNKVSCSLFEKAGFIQTGVRKDWYLVNDVWTDEVLYQKIIQ